MYVVIRIEYDIIKHQNMPSKLHQEKWEAEKEAARLAAENPGVEFYIFEARGHFIASINPVVYNGKAF